MPVAAKSLFVQSMALGWDREKGGFFYTLDWNDNPDKRAKLWWPMSEAAGAAHFLNENLPADAFYEDSYRRIWSTIANNFIDHANGGWHEELTEDLVPAHTLFPGKGEAAAEFQLSPYYGHVPIPGIGRYEMYQSWDDFEETIGF